MGTRWMFAPPSSKASRDAGGSEMSFIKAEAQRDISGEKAFRHGQTRSR
jgi:hypothetical protein